MSTKPAQGPSADPTTGTKDQARETGKVVAPKPTQKPEASRPLGVTSSGSIKIT